MTTCKGRLSESVLCDYQVFKDEFCILHSPDMSKSHDEFLERFEDLRGRFRPDGTKMLGIVFPGLEWRLTQIVDNQTNSLQLIGVTFGGNLIIDSHGPSLIPINIRSLNVKGNIVFRSQKTDHFVLMTLVTCGGELELRSSTIRDFTFQAQSIRSIKVRETVTFSGRTCFANSTILESADFRTATFNDYSNFNSLTVKGDLNLENVTFNGETEFEESQFGRINLRQTKFIKNVTFENSNVGKCSENILRIHNAEQKITLIDADLSRLLLMVDSADEMKPLQLSGARWHTNDGLSLLFRGPQFHKFEELNLDDAIRQMRIYGEYFLRDHRVREAGFFYIREMELLRDNEKWYSLAYLTSASYSLVSRYGESFLRPLIGLLIVWAVCSAALFFSGAKVRNGESWRPVNAEFTLDPIAGRPILFESDYWRIVLLNFNLMGPHRPKIEEVLESEGQRALINIETVTSVVLISFLIVALRRRFKKRE